MNAPSPVLSLARELIARKSLTPDDAGCCEVIGDRLAKLGFSLEYLNAEGVTNLWATRGSGAPLFILAGHTDIVPPGPVEHWKSDPFTPTIRDGHLFGRGAADMKSGLSAMVCAVERLLASSKPTGTLAFLITSDEEGYARHGTRHAVKVLESRGIKPDFAIVGEATGDQKLGDRITIGRRGSLGCNLKVLGKQGHVAYPAKADNPIHRLAPALAELIATCWDEGNAHFPPTSFQISNVHSGTGANNVIPGHADVIFNFRYCTESSADSLKERVHAVLDRHALKYEADWWHTGEPFLTEQGALIAATRAAIGEVTGLNPVLFTGGGTSDARFLAPWGAQTIELGPVNDSIHKVDEHVRVEDLDRLSEIYLRVLQKLLR
ncbi:MAG TPA: succinyl-diaminopimelate desuccinylase [Nevskiaceae bacterium]|nr:succinyl-diaminopimelate desuccinylase [Nevskiaceae bacterium]